MNYSYYNGDFYDDSALIHIQDRGFRFGDGVFETMLVRNSTIYQLDEHLSRLQGGLDAIYLPFDSTSLRTPLAAIIAKNKQVDGTIRLTISRGVGSRGYLPTGDTPTLLIECMTPPTAPDRPVRLCISQWRVIPNACLPSEAKLNQGLNYTLARMEADSKGMHDAIMLTTDGMLAEASSASLFWSKDNIIYTPALTTGALPGTTRAALFRLSPLEICEVSELPSTLESADSVWITNAAMGIRAVEYVDTIRKIWRDDTLIRTLQAIYQADIDAQCR